MNLSITTYCRIKNNQVWINDVEIFKAIPNSEKDFLKQLYQHLKIDYPKFFKMDNLSKLGLLTVALIRDENTKLNYAADDEVAIALQTEMGCLDSDIEHQKNVTRNAASPAVFVYTLSNIVIGEIAIKNKWFGESLCLIGKHNDLTDLISYSKSLFLNNKAELVITGTIDSVNNEHCVNLFLIEKEKDGTNFNEENIKKLITH